MTWFVAPSYQNAEIIGDAIDDEKTGKKIIKVRCGCGRCFGTGSYGPLSVFNGVCFECNGKGKVTKFVRAYTEKEYNAYLKAQERTKQKKEEKRQKEIQKKLEESENNRIDWMLNHGFNDKGETFIIVGGNTYEIKDQLKEGGFKYDKLMNWHGINLECVPKDRETAKVLFDQIFEWNPISKTVSYKEDAAATLEEIFYPEAEDAGDFVGEIGEKLKDISAIVIDKTQIESFYGTSFIVKFKDNNNNIYVWFSNSILANELNKNDSVLLAGTVKKYQTYKNEKQTVLTRCKIA